MPNMQGFTYIDLAVLVVYLLAVLLAGLHFAKKEMKGIYSSCISADTLDEAPFAYRGLSEIKEAVKDTIAIKEILKPVYSFKAGKE